jgi:hypothetical protein
MHDWATNSFSLWLLPTCKAGMRPSARTPKNTPYAFTASLDSSHRHTDSSKGLHAAKREQGSCLSALQERHAHWHGACVRRSTPDICDGIRHD